MEELFHSINQMLVSEWPADSNKVREQLKAGRR